MKNAREIGVMAREWKLPLESLDVSMPDLTTFRISLRPLIFSEALRSLLVACAV